MNQDSETGQLRFLKTMDRVDRAIRGTDDLDQMMETVLESVKDIFRCDRVWLMYPCDPGAPVIRVPMESTSPAYPGAHALNRDIPVTPDLAESFRAVLESESPRIYHPEAGLPLPETARKFAIQSSLNGAIYPKVGKPWMWGVSQCSHPRQWTAAEIGSFQEIGRRLADALGLLLTLRHLKESEARYRTIVETTPNFISITRVADGLFLEVNDYFQRIMGYTREEAIGRTVFDLALFADPLDRDRLIQTLTNEGEVNNLPMQYRRKGGAIIETEISAKPMMYAGEECLISIVSDVTKHKKTEQALRESERKLRAIFDQTFQFIGVLSTDGTLLDANQSSIAFAGVSAEEVLGKPFWETVWWTHSPEQQDRLKQAIRHAADGHMARFEAFHPGPDGTLHYVDVSIQPVKDEAGNVYLLIPEGRDITERKIAEAELQKSEARYRSMWENTGTAAVMIEADRTISMANAEFEKLTGLSKEEIEGKRKWTEFVIPADLDKMRRYHDERRRIGGRAPRQYEFGLVNAEGEVRHVVNTVDVIPGTQRSIASLIDISERKKIEEGLRKSEELYTTLLAAIPDIVVRTDIEGTILFVNDFALEISGYDRSEIEGKNMLAFIAPEDQERVVANTLRMFEQPLGPKEYHMIMKDGSRRLFEVNGDILRDKDDAPYGMVNVCRDITERKKNETALKESEERYRAVLEVSPDPIVAYDIAGRVTYINPAFTRVFGWTLEELRHRTIDYVPENQRPATTAMIDKVKRGEEFAGFETQRLSKTGQIVDISMSAATWRDSSGNPVGSVVTLRDITDRKRLEKQLVQAQKMEAIGTLAGGIAHDFNNILSAIIGFTEICAGSVEKGSMVFQNLQKVLRAGERARNLVQQILAFSRQSDLERKPVQVSLIAREALALLRATLPATIDISQRLDSSSAVMADPTQIHQIIMNLCTNAATAMQENGGRLDVSLADTTADAETADRHHLIAGAAYVKISVSDTGRGMASETMARIFDPFFTTKEIGKGTGMGLSVVHGIIESYGGKIAVDSTPGQGSRFDIFIPAIEIEKTVERRPEQKIPFGSERILFVDDEDLQVDLGEQMLTRLGYQVVSSRSSIRALELFKSEPDRFDLVITDMTMPQMTGEKLAMEIMKIRSTIPIILCTGYSELMSEAQARQIGIKAFVMKPIVVMEMATTIRNVLDSAMQ